MYSVGLLITAQQSGESSGLLGLLILIGLLALIAAAARHSGPTTSTASLMILEHPPTECIDAVMEYMTRRGFAIAYRDNITATFTRPKRANVGIGWLFLLLGLVPGLLYFGLYKGTHTITVVAMRSDSGTQLVFSGDEPETAPEASSKGDVPPGSQEGSERPWWRRIFGP